MASIVMTTPITYTPVWNPPELTELVKKRREEDKQERELHMKLFNVTYQDFYSANSSAYQDLVIGMENSVVGCGSIGSAQSGDLVLICAKKNKLWHAVVGQLVTPLDSCRAWLDQGGREWPYNWTYLPLTSLFIYDVETKEEIIQFCNVHQLNPKNLFHSRFCSNKLLLAVERLITKFAI